MSSVTQQLLFMYGGAAAATIDGFLDSYTTGLTSAYSFGRKCLTSFAGSRYTDSSGITNWYNQSSGGSTLDMVNGGATKATLSTAGPNSRQCGDFDGTGNALRSSGGAGAQLQNYISSSAGWVVVSFIADAIDASNATTWLNDVLFCDSNASMGLFLKNTPVIQAYDDANSATAQTAISTGTAYVAEWMLSGGTLSVRVNKGTAATTSGSNITTMTTGVNVAYAGVHGNAARIFDGKVFELISYSTVPNSTDRDAIVTNMMSYIGAT